MCNKCNGQITRAFDIDVYDSINWWGDTKFKDATTHTESVVFEVRNGHGYIRLVDLDDCGCLDHGKKVEIQFCPFCGRELNGKV